jgi:hypothetical protein
MNNDILVKADKVSKKFCCSQKKLEAGGWKLEDLLNFGCRVFLRTLSLELPPSNSNEPMNQ